VIKKCHLSSVDSEFRHVTFDFLLLDCLEGERDSHIAYRVNTPLNQFASLLQASLVPKENVGRNRKGGSTLLNFRPL
jgi:hypothetical protein